MRRAARSQQVHGAPRLRAKAMHADFVIEREGTGTDKRRQLAGGTPARQIHLEEAVLRVQKTERTSDVLARGAADRGMPSRSRWTCTGAVSPESCSVPSRSGRLARRRLRAQNAPATPAIRMTRSAASTTLRKRRTMPGML